ncbi:hypothetical protein F511_46831 [Dorcoceras hygrometricum]|uniref:Uncharacterized protein n=1 Tax=Dorcoceras hygrometricum TaxID=472368 RepID=A0A2Z6ZSI3_9LAMI|nr:hypothetical protein F511_46831 [Dorcoceras hygrometricum]
MREMLSAKVNMQYCMNNRTRYSAGLFMEVRISTSYISPSSTSEGSTRRFDLTTACTDPIPQLAAVRTPRLLKCTNSRSCVTDYIHKSFTSSCLDGNCEQISRFIHKQM